MDIKNLLKKIEEEFFGRHKSAYLDRNSYEVFKNPTNKEYVDLIKEAGAVRAVLTNKGDLFIVDANMFHEDLIKFLAQEKVIQSGDWSRDIKLLDEFVALMSEGDKELFQSTSYNGKLMTAFKKAHRKLYQEILIKKNPNFKIIDITDLMLKNYEA
jgi:hypothetical protein